MPLGNRHYGHKTITQLVGLGQNNKDVLVDEMTAPFLVLQLTLSRTKFADTQSDPNGRSKISLFIIEIIWYSWVLEHNHSYRI